MTAKNTITSPTDIRSALIERRGRPCKSIEGQNRKSKLQNLATQALNRINRIAKDRSLVMLNPKLVFEANQWLYEIHYGKPKVQIDATITGRIGVFPDEFSLIDNIEQEQDDIIEGVSYRLEQAQDSTLHNLYSANLTDGIEPDSTELSDSLPDDIDQ